MSMNPLPDNHTQRYQLVNTAGAVNASVFVSNRRGRDGYQELIDYVHRKLEVSLLIATTKLSYRVQLVA